MIINKILNKITASLLLKQNFALLQYQNQYTMSFLTDKLAEKQGKKAQQQFKRQIQYMANKPTFTYMDYKQRITDQLNSLKSSFTKKMSQQSKQAQKALFLQKKVMSALFEQELVGDSEIYEDHKNQIALVSQVPIENVKETFKKAKNYMKMHKYLRNKVLKGEPLPESMAELQYEFRQSRFNISKLDRIHQRQKYQKNIGYMRAMRIKQTKFKKL